MFETKLVLLDQLLPLLLSHHCQGHVPLQCWQSVLLLRPCVFGRLLNVLGTALREPQCTLSFWIYNTTAGVICKMLLILHWSAWRRVLQSFTQ